MKLRSRGVVLSLSLLMLSMSATTLSLSHHSFHPEVDGQQMEFSDLMNITLSNKRVIKEADGTDVIVFNYSVQPEGAEGYSFNSFLDWSTKESDEYESASWGSGQDPYSYMTTDLDESKKEISIHCLKPFGRTLKYTLVCRENTNVYAHLNIDYGRKVLDKGGVKFSTTKFTDGVAVKLDVTKPTYSIGSKGEKKDFKAEVKTIEFEKGNSLFKTWAELFPTIELRNVNDTEHIYYDVDLDGIPEKNTIKIARQAMIDRSLQYLKDIICSNGVNKFNRDHLVSLLSYQVIAYNTTLSLPISEVATRLISNYKFACTKGGGLYATLYYDDAFSSKNCFEFDFNAANISNISFGFEGILF